MSNATIGKIGAAVTGLAVLGFAVSLIFGLVFNTGALFAQCGGEQKSLRPCRGWLWGGLCGAGFSRLLCGVYHDSHEYGLERRNPVYH